MITYTDKCLIFRIIYSYNNKNGKTKRISNCRMDHGYKLSTLFEFLELSMSDNSKYRHTRKKKGARVSSFKRIN